MNVDVETERDIFRDAALKMRSERDAAVVRANAATTALAKAEKLAPLTVAKARLWDRRRVDMDIAAAADEAKRLARIATPDARYEVPPEDADLWGVGYAIVETECAPDGAKWRTVGAQHPGVFEPSAFCVWCLSPFINVGGRGQRRTAAERGSARSLRYRRIVAAVGRLKNPVEECRRRWPDFKVSFGKSHVRAHWSVDGVTVGCQAPHTTGEGAKASAARVARVALVGDEDARNRPRVAWCPQCADVGATKKGTNR